MLKKKKEKFVSKLPPDTTVIIARQKRFYSKLIYRAICDLVNYKDSKRPGAEEIYESAYEWMYNTFEPEECDEDDPQAKLRQLGDVMSFQAACYLLKWDPCWVRERVLLLTKKDLEHIGRNGLI